MGFALLRRAYSEEFQAVGVLDHLIGLLGEVLRKDEAEVVGFLVGDRALVGAGLDLVEQDVARPPEAGGGMEIPEELGSRLDPSE
jgi:hypothetical protein